MFLKPNTSVIGPGDPIIYPRQTENLHYEGEVAVVIGRICRDVPPEQATDVIHGYTIGNDVTARDLQKSDVQFTRSKGFDSFCPLGPWIETDLDPQAFADGVRVQTHLNGDLKQDGNTKDMVFDIPTLIAHISSVMTLLPGDVILTGTPEGVGPMEVGDEVEVSDRRPRRADQPGGEAMSTPSASGSVPSPTGSPHVGLARAALFNWAFARHHGGTFVFRIEDTDKERSTEESYDALLETMRWLGLDWDEGPLTGGPHGPYRQSERTDLYRDVLAQLRGLEVHLRLLLHHRRGRRAPQGQRAPRSRGTTASAASSVRSSARPSRPRAARRSSGSGCPTARSPGTTWSAATITFQTEFVPDFALCRANGDPLYTLVNPVDDALMEITHVLRGEDLLSSTPRQIPLHRALVELGVSQAVPEFGHLPFVMGEGNKKLSKRDPQAHLFVVPRPGLPARGAAQLPRPARLGDRRRPRRLHPRGDGGGVRHQGRQPQPGPLRPQEGRGDQRLAHAAAARSRT